VLVIPQLIAEFNLVILISFLRRFPVELEEAALIDGCGYVRRLVQIVLPISKAALATITMYYLVILWNQFQHPLFFIQRQDLFPLQIKIRQMITSETDLVLDVVMVNYNTRTLQAVIITFAVIPVLAAYPFLQKYFTKGALVGSIKG